MFGEKEKTVIYIGSDHAGFKIKGDLLAFLREQDYEVTDLGCFSEEPCDYPDIAREVGEKVLERAGSYGILLCGTGAGVSMAANRLKGIRAVLGANEDLAEMGRRHNDANVLTMGARTTDLAAMKKIALKFLTTPFAGEERHIRRTQKMDEFED